MKALGIVCVLLVACAATPPPKASEPVRVPAGSESTGAGEQAPSVEDSGVSSLECEKFITLVNSAVKDIEQLVAGPGDSDEQSVTAMKRIAELWDELARDVGRLRTSPALRGPVRRYVVMCRRAATTARKVASALEARDEALGDEAQKVFDQVVLEEDKLVNDINALCQRAESVQTSGSWSNPGSVLMVGCPALEPADQQLPLNASLATWSMLKKPP
jgi:hypothetical protein